MKSKTVVLVPDDDELAHLVTVEEAARLLKLSAVDLLAEVSAFHVPALWTVVNDTPTPFLSVAHVRRFVRWRREVSNEAVKPTLLPCMGTVRRYLTEVAPAEEHEEADVRGCALLARAHSRHGAVHAHIRVAPLVTFAERVQAPEVTHRAATWRAALPVMGATPVRGLRDELGRQVGAMWWRLPLTIWRAEE